MFVHFLLYPADTLWLPFPQFNKQCQTHNLRKPVRLKERLRGRGRGGGKRQRDRVTETETDKQTDRDRHTQHTHFPCVPRNSVFSIALLTQCSKECLPREN